MKVFLVPLLFAVAFAADVSMHTGPAGYNFLYHTGDAGGHSRSESGSADGSVAGSYSYVDPNGDVRKVSYTAGPGGYVATGDIGVDRKTAAEAARIAAMAPKAPIDPNHAAVPHHYAGWNHGAWNHGGWNHGYWGHHGAAPWHGGYHYGGGPHWNAHW